MSSPHGAGPGRRPRFPHAAALALLAAALVAGPSPAARADVWGDEERVTAMDVRLELRPDASMHVTERITYDFGGQERHGIYRYLPLRRPFDAEHDRVYPITQIRVSSPTGAPDHWERTADDPVTLRIGEEDRTTRGVQVYELAYDLAGVVDVTASGPELYWNAVGDGWDVPVERATVTLTGPPGTADGRAACYQGPIGATAACPTQVSGGVRTFTAEALRAHQGLTVVAGLPASFAGAAPVLAERWSFVRAFAVTPVSAGLGGGVLAVLAGGAGLLAAGRGRDRRYVGVVPGLEPAPGQQQVRTARAGLRAPVLAVRFTPPKDVRAGEAGTLIDERADVVDVTATIVDLAVRGHLRIEEVEPDAVAGQDDAGTAADGTPADGAADWRLVRTDRTTEGLRAYERTLYEGIFSDRGSVTLSQLRSTFRDDLKATQAQLYRDVVEQGWFTADPRAVRRRWYARGGQVVAAGIGATVLLAWLTHLAVVGVALTLAGVAILVLARRMPVRTASGTALLTQVRGFRLYLEKAEADEIRFEEGRDVFSRYLPYAIVFGVAERWAGVFAELAARPGSRVAPDTGWYRGPGAPGTADGLDLLRFGATVSAFSGATSSSIAAFPAPSSGSSGTSTSSWGGSGGFDGGSSGGGGGGGGGGSW